MRGRPRRTVDRVPSRPSRGRRRPPADFVFIDDLPENVAGARAPSLADLLYRDVPALVVELREPGIEADPSEA